MNTRTTGIVLLAVVIGLMAGSWMQGKHDYDKQYHPAVPTIQVSHESAAEEMQRTYK